MSIVHEPASADDSDVAPPDGRRRVQFHEASRMLLRNSVLDAMRDLLTVRDWSSITMTDVARRAGVSRQTLYNEFASRQGLAQAYALRLADQFVDAVDDAVYSNVGDARRALAVGFAAFFADSSSDPLVQSLLRGDAKPDLLRLITTESAPLIDRASGRLVETFRRSWVQASETDATILARAIVRIAMSYIAMPPESDRDVAADMAYLVGPFLDRVTGGQ
ncbi:TetR family transcriptional regulator [Rhodococcus sp. NPDC003382]